MVTWIVGFSYRKDEIKNVWTFMIFIALI